MVVCNAKTRKREITYIAKKIIFYVSKKNSPLIVKDKNVFTFIV